MRENARWSRVRWVARVLTVLVATAAWAPVWADGYDAALKGVKRVDVVFDVSHGDPKSANVIFWAVRDVYKSEAVTKLAEPAHAVIVFHGPAVKLLSSSRNEVVKDQAEAMDQFAATLREMKKDGVKLEVCMYAVKVMGVDPATLMPEIDRVDNGFVSVAGYQLQGYAVVAIP
ncbi:MAG: DsrE family protein [Deltaproteobacteria bacterium]|nr:DsrE family protein [Deltaproteobacteria bacterium]